MTLLPDKRNEQSYMQHDANHKQFRAKQFHAKQFHVLRQELTSITKSITDQGANLDTVTHTLHTEVREGNVQKLLRRQFLVIGVGGEMMYKKIPDTTTSGAAGGEDKGAPAKKARTASSAVSAGFGATSAPEPAEMPAPDVEAPAPVPVPEAADDPSFWMWKLKSCECGWNPMIRLWETDPSQGKSTELYNKLAALLKVHANCAQRVYDDVA